MCKGRGGRDDGHFLVLKMIQRHQTPDQLPLKWSRPFAGAPAAWQAGSEGGEGWGEGQGVSANRGLGPELTHQAVVRTELGVSGLHKRPGAAPGQGAHTGPARNPATVAPPRSRGWSPRGRDPPGRGLLPHVERRPDQGGFPLSGFAGSSLGVWAQGILRAPIAGSDVGCPP